MNSSVSVWILIFQMTGEEIRQKKWLAWRILCIPFVSCAQFWCKSVEKGRRALTRSACCEWGFGVQAWGIGWEDRALSYFSDHVCCHHCHLQSVVLSCLWHLVFPMFREWVTAMLAVISRPPHDQVLITETRQIVWLCLPVSAMLFSMTFVSLSISVSLTESAMAYPNSQDETGSKQSESTSPFLDYTRRTQVEAQESHTARRIEQLLSSPPADSRREKLSGDNGSISPKVGRRYPLLDAGWQAHLLLPPGYEEATASDRNAGQGEHWWIRAR